MRWTSFSTHPRVHGPGYSYVATDLGDVTEGGWVNPFDPQAAYYREETIKELKKILDEIEAEEKWQKIEDHIDAQIKWTEYREKHFK